MARINRARNVWIQENEEGESVADACGRSRNSRRVRADPGTDESPAGEARPGHPVALLRAHGFRYRDRVAGRIAGWPFPANAAVRRCAERTSVTRSAARPLVPGERVPGYATGEPAVATERWGASHRLTCPAIGRSVVAQVDFFGIRGAEPSDEPHVSVVARPVACSGSDQCGATRPGLVDPLDNGVLAEMGCPLRDVASERGS